LIFPEKLAFEKSLSNHQTPATVKFICHITKNLSRNKKDRPPEMETCRVTGDRSRNIIEPFLGRFEENL
jgi:hypothetical protein